MSDAIKILSHGGIVVMPSDTIYGLFGQALNKKVVQLIYHVRRRSPDKPFIILISSINDLKLFGIKINREQKSVLGYYWPGKISIILPCRSAKFSYLHRGTKTLAFRLPKDRKLISILKKTGPLVAPSANPEGEVPAATIAQAKMYFGDSVDGYFSGRARKKPSTLVTMRNDGRLEVIRQGAVKIK